ncbi:MAG: hypothetical protein AB7L84_15325 [Acidimicrobiia bacterium]
MKRLVVSGVTAVAANAIGLIVAAALLSKMRLNGVAFITAVIVFTVVELIAVALIRRIAEHNARALLGATALLGTLVALVVTDALSDGLSISGPLTWVLATLIVWLAALVAEEVLPRLLLGEDDRATT